MDWSDIASVGIGGPWGYAAKKVYDYASGSGGETPFSKTDSLQTPTFNPDGYSYGGSHEAEQAMRARYRQQQAEADQRHLDWRQPDQDRANSLAARGQQSALSTIYQRQIAGQGPSVAEAQLYAGQQANAQQQAAMAAGTRGGGGNILAAQRMAQRQAAFAGLATNRDAAMLRAQEQQNAMQGQGALLNTMRQGDVSQGQLDQQRQVQQTQLNDQRNQYYQGAEQHVNDQRLNGSMAFEQNKNGMQAQTEQFNAGLTEADKKRTQQYVGMGLNAASKAGGNYAGS